MSVHWPRTIGPGLMLGFTVARLGFADYNELHQMLVFHDLRLLWAFAGAVGLSIVLFASLRQRLKLGRVQFHAGIVPGAILFGIGWAVTGACPGVALIQLGQGIWPAGASFGGILLGIWIHDRFRSRPGDSDSSC